MRVLLINKFWYPKGGSERYTFLLKDLLEANGHEVVPFGVADERNMATPWAQHFAPHVEFWDSDGASARGKIGNVMRVLWNRDAARCLDALLAVARPDVAHLQNFAHQLSPSILPVLKRHGVPIVWTLHDYKLLCPNYRMYTKGLPCERCKGHSYANAIRYNCMGRMGASATVAAEMVLHHSLMNVYGKHVDTVIAPSAFLAEKLVAWEWEGRVEILPNFVMQNAECRMQNDRNGVLFVGRLVEEKGIADFCDAAGRLTHISFVVIGSGPIGRRLPNVEWRGARPAEEITKSLATARMLVVPSRWYENAPYVVLEAMAAGVPVIASNIGGLPELVRDGETGVLVPPRDAHALANSIEMLYSDPSRAAALGARAQEIVRSEYGPKRHYHHLAGIYEELTAG
ncbi:glycosyltransferase [Candidatus Uhrbacteria bacterium]|nr:glycosyltransferase [Candidatus Uhrbacteria bacterium]